MAQKVSLDFYNFRKSEADWKMKLNKLMPPEHNFFLNCHKLNSILLFSILIMFFLSTLTFTGFQTEPFILPRVILMFFVT